MSDHPFSVFHGRLYLILSKSDTFGALFYSEVNYGCLISTDHNHAPFSNTFSPLFFKIYFHFFVIFQDVDPIYHNGPGFGYIIRYRKQGSTTWSSKRIPYGNNPLFTIYNTSASEPWEFKVDSYNDEGSSQTDCPAVLVRSGKEGKI